MFGPEFSARYDFDAQTGEDQYGKHSSGRRRSDDAPMTLSLVPGPGRLEAAILATLVDLARRLATTGQAGILCPVEVGVTADQEAYVVTEACSWPTLKTLIAQRKGLSVPEAMSVAYSLAATLLGASGVGVNHLDLSASRIHVLFEDGAARVRVGGYGLSMLLPGYAPARRNEPFAGTAEYMAPEMCSGNPGTAASDLYSLGILMYEMICGKPPFVSSNPLTTIKRQVYEKPLPMHLVKPGVPRIDPYEKLVANLLAKDPKARPTDAKEVLDALATMREEGVEDANLRIEDGRTVLAHVTSTIDTALLPAPRDAVNVSRETLDLTGLSEVVRRVQAVSAPVAAPEPVQPAPETAVWLPVSPPAAAAAVDQTPSAPAADLAHVVGVKDLETGEAVATQDWFVASSERIPENLFPSEDVPPKGRSRRFVILVSAAVVAVAFIGILALLGWYFNVSGKGRENVRGTAVHATAELAAPQRAEAVSVPTRPSSVVTDEAAAKEAAAREAAAQEAAAREAAAKEAAAKEAAAKEAAAKEAAAKAAAAKEAAAKEAAAKEAVREAKKPVVKAAPRTRSEPKEEPKPPEDPQEVIKRYIRAGRDAYNRGEYQQAIGNYNRALAIDRNNTLVQRLLEQARAKAQ